MWSLVIPPAPAHRRTRPTQLSAHLPYPPPFLQHCPRARVLQYNRFFWLNYSPGGFETARATFARIAIHNRLGWDEHQKDRFPLKSFRHAYLAARQLQAEKHVGVIVVNLPFGNLCRVDGGKTVTWLEEAKQPSWSAASPTVFEGGEHGEFSAGSSAESSRSTSRAPTPEVCLCTCAVLGLVWLLLCCVHTESLNGASLSLPPSIHLCVFWCIVDNIFKPERVCAAVRWYNEFSRVRREGHQWTSEQNPWARACSSFTTRIFGCCFRSFQGVRGKRQQLCSDITIFLHILPAGARVLLVSLRRYRTLILRGI